MSWKGPHQVSVCLTSGGLKMLWIIKDHFNDLMKTIALLPQKKPWAALSIEPCPHLEGWKPQIKEFQQGRTSHCAEESLRHHVGEGTEIKFM